MKYTNHAAHRQPSPLLAALWLAAQGLRQRAVSAWDRLPEQLTLTEPEGRNACVRRLLEMEDE